jgi:hypothetical protein
MVTAHRLCVGVNRRTLQRDLNLRVEKRLLVRNGTGSTEPTRHCRPAEAVSGPGNEL